MYFVTHLRGACRHGSIARRATISCRPLQTRGAMFMDTVANCEYHRTKPGAQHAIASRRAELCVKTHNSTHAASHLGPWAGAHWEWRRRWCLCTFQLLCGHGPKRVPLYCRRQRCSDDSNVVVDLHAAAAAAAAALRGGGWRHR